MSAVEPQMDRRTQHLLARFQEMGLSVRPMADGRSLLVSLELGPSAFESLIGPLVIERVVFSSVGDHQIKCLRPRPLFGLPLIDIRDCHDAISLEGAIRRAFRERTRTLRDTQRWLEGLGLEATASDDAGALRIPVPGEAPGVEILMHDRHAAILPSHGPLSDLTLEDYGERVFGLSSELGSGADLECQLAARIDALAERARQKVRSEREQRVLDGPSIRLEEKPTPEIIMPDPNAAPLPHVRSRSPKVLIVGQRLIENGPLREELKRRGYRSATARSETEALTRLAGTSPDVVISEFGLGRSDGATLVQATRALAGIEGIPVVLLDDTAHESRREAARAAGASGYVIGPGDVPKFVARLTKLIDAPGRRRFTRYPGRLSARLEGLTSPCLATEVGRGGVFIATDADIDLHAAMECEIALPEIARGLRFEGEVLYRAESQGALPGLGLQFADISPEDEASLIAYVTRLDRNHAGSR